MLPSGAHIKLGSYELYLAEPVDTGSTGGGLYTPHYQYNPQLLIQNPMPIMGGGPDSPSLRPGRLVTYFADFSGGEGNRYWDPQDPTAYNIGIASNPRIPQQITGRPTRTYDSTSLVTVDNATRPRFAVAAGTLWSVGGYDLNYISTAPSTWSKVNTSATTASDYGQLLSLSNLYRITAACGDGTYLYYSASRAGPLRTLMAKKKDTATNLAVSLVTTAESALNPYADMCIMNGTLFAWTGVTMDYYNVASWDGATALTANSLFGGTSLIPSAQVLNTDYFAGMVPAENSCFAFYSSKGQSTLYQVALQQDGSYTFAPIYTPQLGFTIRSIAYSNGVVFLAGQWESGFGELWAIPQDSHRPLMIDWVRKQNAENLKMERMVGSYGTQVILADAGTGKIFIYDANQDGITQLDALATSGTNADYDGTPGHAASPTDALSFVAGTQAIGDMVTWGNKRIVSVYTPGSGVATAYPMLSYSDDEPPNRQAGTATNSAVSSVTFGDFDNNLPFQTKQLLGYDLTFIPLTTGQTITVEYSLDGAAFVTAAAVTSATTGSATGRVYIDLSGSTLSYTNFKTRLTLTATNGNLPPQVTAFAGESILLAYEYVWDLIIRMQNPTAKERGSKASTMTPADKVRDYIRTVIDTRAVVTFLDGYRYRAKGGLGVGYSSHQVTIEDPRDRIMADAQGNMRITLRGVGV